MGRLGNSQDFLAQLEAGGGEARGVRRRTMEPMMWALLGQLRPEQVSSGHDISLLSPSHSVPDVRTHSLNGRQADPRLCII